MQKKCKNSYFQNYLPVMLQKGSSFYASNISPLFRFLRKTIYLRKFKKMQSVDKAISFLKKWLKTNRKKSFEDENLVFQPTFSTQEITPAERKYCLIRDWKISYIEQGKGKHVLLLVHGLGSEASHWQKNISVWAEKFRVIAIDLPGYGSSEKRDFIPREGMINFFADILLDFLKVTIANEEITLVGHSIGGQTAMLFAAKYPEKVKKLVLLAPAGIEEYSQRQVGMLDNLLSFYPVVGKNQTAIRLGFRHNFHKMPPDAEPLIQERIALAESEIYPLYCKMITQCIRAIITTKVDYARIKAPALVVFGENDKLIPNSVFNPKLKPMHIADRAGKLIADSSVVMLKDTGHFLQFENADVVNKLVADFVFSA
jgi:pimeloyl-ACP methyl ester carboxylesterase